MLAECSLSCEQHYFSSSINQSAVLVAGKGKMKVTPVSEFGILDHEFEGADLKWKVYVRVVPNEEGSTTTWTFMRPVSEFVKIIYFFHQSTDSTVLPKSSTIVKLERIAVMIKIFVST